MSLDRLGGKAKTYGNQSKTSVHDDKTVEALNNILVELRYMRICLMRMSDLELEDVDVHRGKE